MFKLSTGKTYSGKVSQEGVMRPVILQMDHPRRYKCILYNWLRLSFPSTTALDRITMEHKQQRTRNEVWGLREVQEDDNR
jgi:hypothetical protein